MLFVVCYMRCVYQVSCPILLRLNKQKVVALIAKEGRRKVGIRHCMDDLLS